MAGGGFGSLDSMIKSIKSNANLLRRKSMFQVIKESGDFKKKEPFKYKQASSQQLADIKQNTIDNNRTLLLKKLVVLSLTVIIVGGIGYFLFAGNYKIKDITLNKEYPKSETTALNDETVLRIQYFNNTAKASEELLRYGKKHGRCQSYYPTGELFRTAEYNNDSLLHEIYFYPLGGEIVDFQKRYPGDPVKVKLLDRGMKKYTFYCTDGKIIPNTFEISTQ